MWTTFVTAVLAAAPGPDPEAHLLEARRRLRDDDIAAVRDLARDALAIPGEHRSEAALLLGTAWHLDGRPDVALPILEEALADDPLGASTRQITFAIAECRAELAMEADGRGRKRGLKDAERWLARARDAQDPSITDAAKMDVDAALWRAQRKGPRGTRELIEVLDDTDHDLGTLQQARARTWLVETWLDAADRLGVDDPTHLERRAVFLEASEKQLRATIDHDHPSWTLRQLHRLGQSYEILGDDVVTAALPDDADARRRAEVAWVKATRLYDMGVRHAARTFRDHEAVGLEIAHQLVVAKVDGLSR